MKASPIDGRLALVTGAARGLGAAIARALGERGARLILCDIDGDGVAAQAEALGAVEHATLDVADAAAVDAFAARVHAAHGPLGVLVNNAGVVAVAPALEMPADDWRWMFGVNVEGVVNGCRAFGPAMLEAPGRGHIVNIASAAGFVGVPMLAGYAVGKAAVLSYSEALRAELPRAAIGVSVICPGFVQTRLAETGRYAGAFDNQGMRAAARRVMDRRGRSPADVGRAVVRAIEKDRFLVPVFAEGRLMSAVRSLPAGLRMRLMPLGNRLLGGPTAEERGSAPD